MCIFSFTFHWLTCQYFMSPEQTRAAGEKLRLIPLRKSEQEQLFLPHGKQQRNMRESVTIEPYLSHLPQCMQCGFADPSPRPLFWWLNTGYSPAACSTEAVENLYSQLRMKWTHSPIYHIFLLASQRSLYPAMF